MATYNTLSDFRVGIAEQYVVVTDTTINAGTEHALPLNDGVSVIAVTKNGATLTPTTDYSFRRPNYFKPVAAVNATDVLRIRLAIRLEDEEIQRVGDYVRKTEIDAELVKAYTLPFSEVPQTIKDIEYEWVRGMLMLEYGPRPNIGLSDKDRELAFNRISRAKKELAAVINGEKELILADNSILARKTDPDELQLDVQIDATGVAT